MAVFQQKQSAEEPKKSVDKKKDGDYIDLREQLSDLSEDELRIVGAIEKESTHVDDIIEKSGLPTGTVLRLLTMLTIRRYVKRNPGNYYSLNITKK
jgi:predicted Rossmann fold nucleotide-binding protein DprA/Smf involved in DNA uptake